MKTPRFSIRSILVFTVLVALATLTANALLVRRPPPFVSLQELLDGYPDRDWKIEVAPDVAGPFRNALYNGAGYGPIALPSGVGAQGYVSSGKSKRKFFYPGRVGYAYRVFLLENKDSQPTYMIISCPSPADDGLTEPRS